MTLQEIENAVLRQLPNRKQHLPTNGLVTKEFSPENIFVIICGMASVYLTDPQKTVTEFYDITPKEYYKYVADFTRHLSRVKQVIEGYGVSISEPDYYTKFSKVFWEKHNQNTLGEKYKSGLILSHLLSSKREFREKNTTLREGDFTSFFIYNKARLTRNYLFLSSTKKTYVDFLAMAY
jgi:hypothetical protein